MFSFEKVFSDILKIYKRIYIYNEISNSDQNHLSQNNNLPGKFYAPTACDFWTLSLFILLKIWVFL